MEIDFTAFTFASNPILHLHYPIICSVIPLYACFVESYIISGKTNVSLYVPSFFLLIVSMDEGRIIPRIVIT